MIEERDYRLPKQEQPKAKPKVDPATLAYLGVVAMATIHM